MKAKNRLMLIFTTSM